jgi:uncharacterized protein (TIGR03000 family)
MFQKAFSFVGTLLLTGAAILMMPGLSQAQHGGGHGGGGHGGGGHGGGSHFGGYHGGGYHASFHSGSYHQGGYYGGYRPSYGYHHNYYPHYGYSPYSGYRHNYYPYYGYPYYGSYNYYPYSSYYPYYGSTGYYSPAYGSEPDLGSDSAVLPLVSESYVPATPSYSNAVQAPADRPAHVTVRVPANAEIWVNDSKTTTTGSVREYQTPPLTPGKRYTYEIRARWSDNGQEVTQTQEVEVTAGVPTNVQFPVSPKGLAAAPAPTKS